jgi:hypothetical protein
VGREEREQGADCEAAQSWFGKSLEKITYPAAFADPYSISGAPAFKANLGL